MEKINKTTPARVLAYETVIPLLNALHSEFQELSKKKQDGNVGIPKVKIVNRVLDTVHEVLADEPDFSYLQKLDEDDLPQNSDVVLVLGLTVAAMQAFWRRHHHKSGYDSVWSV